VFGFLGPNGAGKTTAIKILTTLIQPSSGTVKIFGKDILSHSMEIRKRIGVVMQQPSFEANLTVERALELYGFMWKLPSRKRKEKVIELFNAFDLENIRNIKNDELSIGQRRRVQVAREFMHDMDLLFLDEPTVGLDPSARPVFTDENAACMVISEDIYSMLMTEKFFKNFILDREICDTKRNTEVFVALTVGSPKEVDELVGKAVEAGGSEYRQAQDYGWMYGRAFQDINGHIWEITYANLDAMPEEMRNKAK
jgi:predicted lactoylglutathione lyase